MKSLRGSWLFFSVFCAFLFGVAGGAQAQTDISNSPGWFSTCPRLTVDPSGNIHVVWAEFYTMNGNYPTSGDAFYKKYSIATQQWSSPVNLSNTGRCYSGEWYVVGIDSDPSGNVYLVYVDGNKVMLRILAGGSWGAPFEVGSNYGSEADGARIAVDAQSNIFICWYEPFGSIYSRARVGGRWEDIATLSYPYTRSKFPEISVGANQVYCVFMDNHANPYAYNAVYVHRATTFGAGWSGSQRMTSAGEAEEHPAVRVDANDVAHVVYTPYFDSDGSRDVRYVEGTSSGFSAPIVLGSEGCVHYPALSVRGTNVYACWQSVGVHYRNRVGGTWAAENAVPNASCYALTDVAASPSQDKLYYVSDTSSGDIYYSELAGPGPVQSNHYYWRIAGTGDFNSDGERDILWRYYGPEGYNAIWYMRYSGAISIMSNFGSPEADDVLGSLQQPSRHGNHAQIEDSIKQATQATTRVTEAIGEKKPPQVFRDALEVGELLNGRNWETVEMKIPVGERGLIDPREIAGEGTMRVQALTHVGQDTLQAIQDTKWEIAGTGDFNNDGKPDILARYYGSEGYVVILYMDGATNIGQALIRSVTDPNWRIVGTGDFNNDGKPDILWRYYGTEGYNVVWYMDGATYFGQDVVRAVTNPNWRIVGTGDFNKDGKTDILWRYYGAEGYNVVWYMDGVNYLGQDMIRAVTNTKWEIAATADFNKDGKPDILWRYYGPEGYNVVWYMDGVNYIGQDMIQAVANPN